MAAVCLALFCVQIDYFAINLALPQMAGDFDSTTTDLQWVVSVYMVTLGALMVPAGRLADIFGRKRALLAGVALFGLASLLCAVAPSVATLVGFRALQGAGAALIFPASVSVITNAFPPEQAGRKIGLAYGIAGLGNAAGPLIGGLLTQTVGWRWIFALNIPLTVACLIIGAFAISESRDTAAPRRIDIAGLALLTSGIGVFTLTFDRAPVWGWPWPGIWPAISAATWNCSSPRIWWIPPCPLRATPSASPCQPKLSRRVEEQRQRLGPLHAGPVAVAAVAAQAAPQLPGHQQAGHRPGQPRHQNRRPPLDQCQPGQPSEQHHRRQQFPREAPALPAVVVAAALGPQARETVDRQQRSHPPPPGTPDQGCRGQGAQGQQGPPLEQQHQQRCYISPWSFPAAQ